MPQLETNMAKSKSSVIPSPVTSAEYVLVIKTVITVLLFPSVSWPRIAKEFIPKINDCDAVQVVAEGYFVLAEELFIKTASPALRVPLIEIDKAEVEVKLPEEESDVETE